MKRFLLVLIPAFMVVVLLLLSGVRRSSGKIQNVAAASSGGFNASLYLQSTDGGMAQYGYSLQRASSSSETLQALAEWNSYIGPRSQWGLSSTLLSRVAVADWNARRAGPPAITPQQLATAGTNLINAKLAGMTAEEQVAGFKRMMREATPKGTLGLNPLVPHISANRQNDNRWIVTVAPTAFSSRKAELAQLAPGMVSSGDNFYPGEALLVSYSVASGDMGFGLDHQATVKRLLSNLTGLDMNNRQLYGENGYFVRRPLNTFLTESAMNQYFLELGF